MNYRDWHVGMKVVCVDNGGQEPNLTVGRIYTLSAIGGGIFGKIFVQLAENPVHDHGRDWYASRFRPVQPRKTDISVFTGMLDKTKVPA